MSRRILCTLAAAALGVAQLAFGQRLIQLPSSDTTVSPQAGVFTLSPFVREKLIPVGIDTAGVYLRNDPTPANITYWVLSRAGTDALKIYDSQFVFKKSINFGTTAGAAAMSPDGRLFAMTVLNNVRVFDALAETEIQFNAIDIGGSAVDAVITHDSKRLYVFSVAGQRITAIDLASRTVVGRLDTPFTTSTTAGTLTLGPNGLLYAAYDTTILEIDPTVPLGTDAVRKRMVVGGKAGRVQITPDGTRALVTSSVSTTGQGTAPALLTLINLVDGTNSPAATPAELAGGPVFEELIVAGNSVAFGIANTTPRKLYKISLPSISATTGTLDPPTLQEAFFSSKATLETAQYLAVTGEYPLSQQLFVAARLSQLSSAVPDGIFQIDIPRNAYLGQQSLPSGFSVGPLTLVRPAVTANAATPTTLVSLGTGQSNIPAGGRSRPIGVRVLDANGLPISGAVVTFLSSLSGVTFEGADATGNVVTNSNGYAFVVAIAPNVSGVAQITASTPGIAAASTVSLTIGTSSGGGGGGTGTGAANIAIVSGNGQGAFEGESTLNPLVVRVTDSQGRPVPGVLVTWTGTALGRPLDGEATGDQLATVRVTTTDDKGLASNHLLGERQLQRASFTPLTLTASTVSAGSVDFVAVSYPQVVDGSSVPKPGSLLVVPDDGSRVITGRAGELLADAIQVRFVASGFAAGAPIPNLGIEIAQPSGTNVPTAACSPDAAALSAINGLASCSLRLGGVVGTAPMTVLLGGGLGQIVFTLNVLPGLAGQITKVSGDNQSGLPNTTLPNQLVVRVADSQGTPLSGQVVNWTVKSGTASVSSSSSTTSAGGLATVTLNLGATPGTVQVQAQVASGTNPSVTFVATINANIGSMTKVNGDGQSAIVGTAFASPLVVELRDNRNALVQGTNVTFSVVSGSVSLLGNATVTSNASGQAAINVQAGNTVGTAIVRASAGNNFTQDFTLTVRPFQIFDLSAIRNVNTNAPGTNPTSSTTNPGGMTPGGLYRIYATGVGTGLNGVQTANFLIGPLPKRLRGIVVQVGAETVPIFQVENIGGQEAVVIQAPFTLVPGSADSVSIQINDGAFNTVNNVPIVPVQPGIFETVDAKTSQKFVVAQHLDGRYVTLADPAKLGEQIRAYFTGGGKLLATLPNSGEAGPGTNYTGDVIVGVNGSGVKVVSTRYTPGMVGVYDVVFEVPSAATLNPGDNPNTLATGPNRPFAIGVRPAGGSYVVVNSVIPIQ